ncbi:QRFP-like peptide receptor isoform X2 [Zophobas morio]|uniref:QRFP-like peptide receptor isoform X2 n=1 Tax=Zophobas morio TaxID=2755281 RepID=UPI003083D81E
MNDSNSTDLDVEELLRTNQFLVIGLYVPVFVTALLANVLVIWVVIKDQYMRRLRQRSLSDAMFVQMQGKNHLRLSRNLRRRVVTNYFLVNLSAADLLVTLVCMPNAAYRAYTSIYSLGEYTCKISAYFQGVSVASSIFTITAMALDRYLAITRPFGFIYRCFNRRTTIMVILVLWLLSFLLFLPILMVVVTWKVPDIPFQNRTLYVDLYFCGENWNIYFGDVANEMRLAFGITWFIFMFVVPGLIMLFAYSMMSRTLCSGVPPFDSNDGLASVQQRNRLIRSRRRVACILLLLAFVFAGCWLPYHIISLVDDINGASTDESLKTKLLLLGHANSALNPIIYCALSRRFRNSIRDLICVEIHFTRRRQNMQLGLNWYGNCSPSKMVGRQFRIRHAAPLLAQD